MNGYSLERKSSGADYLTMNDNREGQEKELPFLVADGTLSDEMLKILLNYGHEEEHLDYKETLECGETRKRGRVDLVCDLVAMANTHGGYIVVGVRDEKNGEFTPVGASDEVLSDYTSENIVTWLANYTDGQPQINVRSAPISGLKYLFVFVKRSPIPLVFRKDGVYMDEKDSENVKFRSADIFVRHGSKSERVTGADVSRMLRDVREDERQKVFESKGRHLDLIEKLDSIVELLGGQSLPTDSLALSESKADRIEDRIFRPISVNRPKQAIWLLKKEFRKVKDYLREIVETTMKNELPEALDRKYVGFLRGLVPVWRVVVDFEELDIAGALVNELFGLLKYSNDLEYDSDEETDVLWLVSRITFLAYSLGAYAVLEDAPAFARLFLGRDIEFDHALNGYSWFRFTSIKLARANRSKYKTICRDVFEYYQTDAYLVGLFGGEEGFLTGLCQFDFLVCVYALVTKKGGYFPSFAAYNQTRIELMAERLARTREQDLWLPSVDGKVLAEAIRTLDAQGEKQFFMSWYAGLWSGRSVQELLNKYGD